MNSALPLAPFRPLAIPNENIRRCPGCQRTNQNDVAKAVNGNRNFIYAPGIFRIKQDITKDASYGSNGHARGGYSGGGGGPPPQPPPPPPPMTITITIHPCD